jgi:hypothetical protein
LFSLLMLAGTIVWYTMRNMGSVQRDATVAHLDATEPLWRTTALTGARNAALPPAEQNAALQAKKAFEQISESFQKWSRTAKLRADLKPGYLPNADELRAARRVLLDSHKALATARAIRHIPDGGFPLTFAEPVWMITLMPDIQNTRWVAYLLDVHALIAAHDRKGDEAIESVHACLAVSRGIGDEPTLISQLVRMAEASIAVHSTERVLGLCEASDVKLAELQAVCVAEAEVPRMLYGLLGERAGFQRVLENIDAGAVNLNTLQGSRGTVLERVGSIPIRATIPEQHETGLRMFNQMVEAAKKPHGAARDAEMAVFEAEFLKLPRYRNLVLGLLLPATTKVNAADTRTTAQLRCASVALACERYRLKHKMYPASLADLPKELLPTVPNDPYTGRPLLYKKTENGAVIYCTGQDRRDDGGLVLDASGQKDDLGFRLFDLKHRRQPPLPKSEPIQFESGMVVMSGSPETTPSTAPSYPRNSPPPISPRKP